MEKEKRTVARFEKVSLDTFIEDLLFAHEKAVGNDVTKDNIIKNAKEFHDDIILPKRATTGSAGYDFFLPANMAFHLPAKVIATGVRCQIEEGYFLKLVPKSGLSRSHGTKFLDTVGIIDSDYYNSPNGGHITADMYTERPLTLQKGRAFMQGIILPYYLAEEEQVTATRNGGYGSTGG